MTVIPFRRSENSPPPDRLKFTIAVYSTREDGSFAWEVTWTDDEEPDNEALVRSLFNMYRSLYHHVHDRHPTIRRPGILARLFAFVRNNLSRGQDR